MISNRFSKLILVVIAYISLLSADSKDNIRLNQVGFYTFGPKVAVVVSPQTWYFSIKSTDLRQTFYRGELSATKYWNSSDDSIKVADFSDFTREGSYVLYVSGIGSSYKFTISNKVNYELSRGLIRHFYYQRASTTLLPAFADKWARAGGHYDTKVFIHPSAASAGRAAGQVFSSPKGWYDAGDYGKYIVNAGISTYQLLLLYEQFPEYFDRLSLNIPESNNSVPDLLDEIKWELDWMLTMQDPTDGGVYHKLTGKTFIGDLMPDAAEEERFFIGKSTAATFDFAAVCAVAYRIYKKFYPAFADSCLQAAKYAYQWGISNPKAHFRENPADVVTGDYRDSNAKDEYQWASWELYIATDNSTYMDTAKANVTSYVIPSWQTVGTLGMYSMALIKNDSFAVSKISGFADGLLKTIESHPFRTSAKSFYWGSNGNVANEGMAMLVAFLIFKDCKYLEGAIHSLDYLLGRNGPGYCFVTGFGTRSTMNPHHRPSTADGIADPVPGFLSGGPNSSPSSGECASGNYPVPSAKKWLDQNCSYSTNEVAINWNAPAAFLAGGIEAVFNSSNFNIQQLIDKYGVDSISPLPADVSVTDVLADRATLKWKTSEKTSASVQYSTDSLMNSFKTIICSGSDSNSVCITGLVPDKKHYVKISFIDKNGNVSAAEITFITASTENVNTALMKPVMSNYVCGSDLSFSFQNYTGIKTVLIYSKCGSSVQESLSCSENNGAYSVTIPGTRITTAGINYWFLFQKDNENVKTQTWSAGPDSIHMINAMNPGTYSLVSFPGLFMSAPSNKMLATAFGDTSSWRYYGYDPFNKTYTPFDTLRSGSGGWLICKEKKEINIVGKNPEPDTLFPVVLREGYNCVGNPFPFPVYWSNAIIRHDDALIGITDSVSRMFLRHQIFLYKDSTANNKNDGRYYTNRELITNRFNDSIRLDPWNACWVYAEKDSVVLLLNPSSGLNIKAGLAKRRNIADNQWFYSICAFNAEGEKQEAVFGAAEDARDTYDEFDSPEPPPITSGLQIGFFHPEWKKYKGMYVSDITSINGVHDWTLSVKNSGTSKVTLQWGRTGVPQGYLYLKDLKTGSVSDITSDNSYSYTPEKLENTRNFIISWIQQKQPLNQLQYRNWNFSLDRTDFSRGLMKFKYTIPSTIHGKDCRTVIEVFDIKGRCVRRILDEKKIPGLYTISWDGKNISGNVTANGFYVIRLCSDSFSQSIGVHIVR